MFDSLSDRFETIFKRLRGRGRMGEAEVDEVLREIRVALLEADVNFKVVQNLVDRIREQCVGADLSAEPEPGPAGHQDRPPGADRRPSAARRSRSPTPAEAADGGPAGRPPGLGQDHRRRQAGPLVQAAGPQPAARRRRPPAPGRRRAAPRARRPGRRPGVQRADRPGGGGPGGLAEARRLGRTSSSSTPPAASPIDDELMEEVRRISRGRRPRLHVPGHRRHDRPGRGQRGRGVPRDASSSTA